MPRAKRDSNSKRHVRLLGDPILRARCAVVENPGSPAVRIVVDELRDAFKKLKSTHHMGRALAAPQIGAPIRVVYAELDRRWILVNPEIVDVGNEDFLVWDDCFSCPDLMVRVQRAYRIKVRYQDLRGKTQTVDLEGDRAELIQHEIDHLDGVLTVDRSVGVDPICLRAEWEKHYPTDSRYGKPTLRTAPTGM